VPSPPSTPPAPAAPPRTFWQRRVRDPLVAQLTQGITPEKLALTVAVGSAIALFPLLGTTSLLCLAAGIALGLNQPIMQLINQAFWPIHVAAIYGCARLGETMFRAPHVSFSLKRMNELFWHSPAKFLHDYGATAFYAIAAWAVLTPFHVALVYFVLKPIFRKIKQFKTQAAKPPA
jgi:uncharacterized protein (DUF2062 family)